MSRKAKFGRIGYPVDDEVLAEVSSVLGWMVDGIEAGAFPHHPIDDTSPFVKCPFCDPDGLGVGDLRRHWEAKRADPLLARYADVAEPPDEADEADGMADG